jgi:hypothetical protein
VKRGRETGADVTLELRLWDHTRDYAQSAAKEKDLLPCPYQKIHPWPAVALARAAS